MYMRWLYLSGRTRIGVALLGMSVTGVAMYVLGSWGAIDHDFVYMIWNLLLAWAALAITLWLEKALRTNAWSSWYALMLTGAWLLFLPNTFYMITDFIHVRELPDTQVVQGVIMLWSFVITGVSLGLLSLYVVHAELLRRVSAKATLVLMGIVIAGCSFAIYVGRELRWNSWDIVTNPTAVLFDVSDRLLNVASHPRMMAITVGFAALITTLYITFFWVVGAGRGLSGSAKGKN